ncbi:hypothetical protein C8Q80DRAFT_1273948 [Daedaleopsis nitida]|nr:hypothetical protein C8Q80DRAFT_1273948 [Daedaleopsis nitida]
MYSIFWEESPLSTVQNYQLPSEIRTLPLIIAPPTPISKMLKHGSLAVAVVQRQVMVVQAARTHSQREPWVDVYTYAPFGDRVFLASPVPQARISSRDILTIFPADDCAREAATGILELPPRAFSEYMELSSRTQKRHEQLFRSAWSRKAHRRWMVL